MKSTQHHEILSESRFKKLKYKGEESYDDEVDEIMFLPKPFDGKGHWVYREDFMRYKTFGYFECPCKKWWLSAHSFKIYKQGCQSCERETYPKYLWFNDEKTENELNSRTSSPHDKARCEACKLGDCIP